MSVKPDLQAFTRFELDLVMTKKVQTACMKFTGKKHWLLMIQVFATRAGMENLLDLIFQSKKERVTTDMKGCFS